MIKKKESVHSEIVVNARNMNVLLGGDKFICYFWIKRKTILYKALNTNRP